MLVSVSVSVLGLGVTHCVLRCVQQRCGKVSVSVSARIRVSGSVSVSVSVCVRVGVGLDLTHCVLGCV